MNAIMDNHLVSAERMVKLERQPQYIGGVLYNAYRYADAYVGLHMVSILEIVKNVQGA